MVSQAKEEGYTEPDPRIDLSGIDVARKILILARESGYPIEIEDIENHTFLPKESLETPSVESFIESLETHAVHFNQLYMAAKEEDKRLKYVATFKEGKASVGLQQIPKEHPFYNLEGKDNIVLFYTERYPDYPVDQRCRRWSCCYSFWNFCRYYKNCYLLNYGKHE